MRFYFHFVHRVSDSKLLYKGTDRKQAAKTIIASGESQLTYAGLRLEIPWLVRVAQRLVEVTKWALQESGRYMNSLSWS